MPIPTIGEGFGSMFMSTDAGWPVGGRYERYEAASMNLSTVRATVGVAPGDAMVRVQRVPVRASILVNYVDFFMEGYAIDEAHVSGTTDTTLILGWDAASREFMFVLALHRGVAVGGGMESESMMEFVGHGSNKWVSAYALGGLEVHQDIFIGFYDLAVMNHVRVAPGPSMGAAYWCKVAGNSLDVSFSINLTSRDMFLPFFDVLPNVDPEMGDTYHDECLFFGLRREPRLDKWDYLW